MKGRIFPGGNKSDFPWLDSELKKRNIKPVIIELKTEGRIYMIKDEDINKLPTDDGEPYLGDKDRGFSIYKVTKEMIDYITKFAG